MKYFLVAVSCVLLLLSTNSAQAEDVTLSVSAHNAYAYATSTMQKNGAVFVELTNTSDADLKITSAKTDVAETVELHTHVMDGDVMMMREVEAYDIPAGESIKLEPMGLHIMLIGLKAPLVEGKSFPVTLMDDNGIGMTFSVEITAPGAMKEPGMNKQMDHQGHDHTRHHGTAATDEAKPNTEMGGGSKPQDTAH